MDPERAATLVEEYQSGLTMREVADRHGFNPRTVQRALRQVGVPTRSPAERSGAPPIEELARLHASAATTAEIATQYGVSEKRVHERLHRHGVDLPRPSRPQGRKRSQAEVDALVERYVRGETLTEIGHELGITKARVGQLLGDSGAPLEALTPLHRDARNCLRDQADRDLLDEMLAANPAWTVQELAEATSLLPGRVKRLLPPEAPARRRPAPRSAPSKGGKALSRPLMDYARVMGLPKGSRLSGPAYDQWASEKGMPSVAALVREFGSWAEATRPCGYQPSVTPQRTYPRLSHESAVATVAAFIADERSQGRPPSSVRYPAWAKQHAVRAWPG